MSEPSAEPPITYKEQVALLGNSTRQMSLLGYVALLYFLTLLLLGGIFMAMLFPLTLAFVRLACIFTPAYHLLGQILGVKGLPARLATPPTWLTIYSIIWVLFHLGIVALLIRVIFFIGFCTQNLICIFGRMLLK